VAVSGSILAALADATEPMTPKEIVASTGMHPNNVWQLLFKMVKDGEAVKVGRGQYRHPDHPEMATPVRTLKK
jgi:DNA-binding IclR family transcriptional regulator